MSPLITLCRRVLLTITASLFWACAGQEIKAPAVKDVEVISSSTPTAAEGRRGRLAQGESSEPQHLIAVIDANIEPPKADRPKYVEVKAEPKLVAPQPSSAEPKPIVPKPVVPKRAVPRSSPVTPKPAAPKPSALKPKPAIEPLKLKPVVIPQEQLRPVDFQLDELPLTIDGQWRLTGHIDHCSLSTLDLGMEDGQGVTTVRVTLYPDNWMLLTQSDIDLSYPDTGLFFDSGEHFALGQLDGDTNVVFKDERARMIDAFVKAKKLKIGVGFWPTWPVTEAKTVVIAIDHFERAYRAWKLCQQRINAR